MRSTGTYQRLGSLNYFIPHPLPPANPPLNLNHEITRLYGEASFALGQLNEMSLKLHSPQRFVNAYVLKEALLSSAIEGIHTTMIDVFTQPMESSKPNKETQLVLNYTHALESALKMLKDENLPLVNRVILHAHKTLLTEGEGDKAAPGHFRKQSVRVGELIPPPANEIPQQMAALEKYINEPTELPSLINAGLVHVQFETIHPFIDGNGRIGRLLIVLMLIDCGLLKEPILYPSYYFKKNHFEYYQTLDRVRTHGDFEGWILFYLKAIKVSAHDAYRRAKSIENLEIELKKTIQTNKCFDKMRNTAFLVLDALFSHPITNISELSKKIDKAYNTVHNILKEFINLDFVCKNTLNKRNTLYHFHPYLALLEKDFET